MRKLPARYLKALGMIVNTMSGAENGLIYTISSITANDIKTTLCLVGGESFDILNSKVNKLVHSRLKDKDLLDEFDALRKRLDTINEKRNQYIHAIWLPSAKKVSRLKYKKKSKDGSLHQFDEHVELQRLTEVSLKLRESTDKLMKLVSDNITLLS
jgi:pullulanase/glycogen debranching enzyme